MGMFVFGVIITQFIGLCFIMSMCKETEASVKSKDDVYKDMIR